VARLVVEEVQGTWYRWQRFWLGERWLGQVVEDALGDVGSALLRHLDIEVPSDLVDGLVVGRDLLGSFSKLEDRSAQFFSFALEVRALRRGLLVFVALSSSSGSATPAVAASAAAVASASPHVVGFVEMPASCFMPFFAVKLLNLDPGLGPVRQ
jgi:hypothetical protein